MGWSFIENYENIDVNLAKLSNIDTIATFCDKGQKLNKTENSCVACPVNEFQGDTHHRKTSCINHGEYTSDMCDDNTYFFKTNVEVVNKMKSTTTGKLSKSDLCKEQGKVEPNDCRNGSFLSGEYTKLRKNYKHGFLNENTQGVCLSQDTFPASDCNKDTYFNSGGYEELRKDRKAETGEIKAAVCSAWTSCKDGEYQTNTPDATTDRVCSALTSCQNGYYETTVPTATTDRVCSRWTLCRDGHYQTNNPNDTTDRVCSRWDGLCPPGEEQTTAPTPTTNRVCTKCQDGMWKTGTNINQCVAHIDCVSNPDSLGGSYKTVNPTSTNDMECATTNYVYSSSDSLGLGFMEGSFM